MSGREHITRLLRAATQGDGAASGELIELVYADLKRQAQKMMRNERANHTLQPTVLVHEAYLQLIQHDRMDWKGRAHFFAMASTLMRRVLVDHARRRLAARRGGGAPKLSLEEGMGLTCDNATDVLAVHEAIEALEAVSPRQAQVVTLRFFGGLKAPEIAAVLGKSLRTIEGDWAMARAWLNRTLSGG